MGDPNLRRSYSERKHEALLPDPWEQERYLAEGDAAFELQRTYDLAPRDVKRQMERGETPEDYPSMYRFSEED